jgi:hypothetical protein
MASPDAPDDPALASSTISLVEYTGEEYETRLSNARLGHADKLAEYNSGPEPLPTMEEVAHALVVYPWLAAVVHRAAQMKILGYHGDHPSPEDFPGLEHLQEMSLFALRMVVPFVRRLGYWVTITSKEETNFPFQVGFAGHPNQLSGSPVAAESRLKAYARGEHDHYVIHLHGTSPMQIRHRGLLKCVPRLLGWLRLARIALADPRRPGAMAALIQENEAGMAEDYPPHWASGEEVQRKRKREMADAVHGSKADTERGARWFKITEHGTYGRVAPVRVEAVAGDYFVFQHAGISFDRYWVHVVHRDAFQVQSWDRQLHEIWRNYSRKGAERHFMRWRDSCVGAPKWDLTNGEES